MTPTSSRRSIRNLDLTADEVGQNCRAARLVDLLAALPRLALFAEIFLDSEEDGRAVEALTTIVCHVREIGQTAKVFRESHERRAAATAAAARTHAEAIEEVDAVVRASEREA